MVIREMSREECLRVLARARLARLACAHENQPYVVPAHLVYHSCDGEACFYGFTTLGQKVEWMRANPLVCVEVDEVTSDVQWVSVIAFGRYEELPGTPECDVGRLPERAESSHGSRATPDTAGRDSERLLAHKVLLQAHPQWIEPAAASRAECDPAEPFIPIFYKVLINQVTGRQATRGARDATSNAVPALPLGDGGWLSRTLTRVFGGRSKEAWLGLLSRTPRHRSNGNAESGKQMAGKQEDRFNAEPKHVDGTDG